MPLRNTFVSFSCGQVEHYNRTFGVNVIALTKVSKFFLSGCIPNNESDRASGGIKINRGDISALSWNIRLLEIPGDVSLREGSFPDAAISYQHKFEGWNVVVALHL